MDIDELELVSKIEVKKDAALIIVDLQNDFMPSGNLAVEEGDKIIEPINELAMKFRLLDNVVIMTQDWHPSGHLSFASSHNMNPYEPYESGGIGPILWPDHCIQGTPGADFHPKVDLRFANAIIRKGYHPNVDSYSTFIENDGKTQTGLSGYLKALDKNRIFLCGLALDYCVYYSAKDGKNMGFETIVPIDLSKPVNSPKDHLSNTLNHMMKMEIKFVRSEDIIA